MPFITQTVFPESFSGTYLTLHFSVRARALGSFTSAVFAIICGNLLGLWLDKKSVSLKTRARYGFFAVMGTQGAWWVYSTIIQNEFQKSGVVYDWADGTGFAKGFVLYLFLVAGFQVNYLYCYFLCGTLVTEPADILRIGGLLRATESAAQ